MSDKVEMTREMWDEAARACVTFAGVLEAAGGLLSQVGATNFYGECSEGRTVRRNVRSAIAFGELSLATTMERQRMAVAALASASSLAGRELMGRDHANATTLPR